MPLYSDRGGAAHARAVIAAFDAAPEAGALSLDGKMIDRPHLVQARRTLAVQEADRVALLCYRNIAKLS
jgi:citrate lyase beta subunit